MSEPNWIEAQFKAVQLAASQRGKDERAALLKAAQDTPGQLVDWMITSQPVNIYIAVREDSSLIERSDEMGLNALHHASADQSGLLTRILTETPSKAPFMRDAFHRRPIDLAIEFENDASAARLMPLTYPNAHRQPELLSEVKDLSSQSRLAETLENWRNQQEQHDRETRQTDLQKNIEKEEDRDFSR